MRHNVLTRTISLALALTGCDLLEDETDSDSSAGGTESGEPGTSTTGDDDPSDDDGSGGDDTDGGDEETGSAPPFDANRPSCEGLDPICAGESCCTALALPGGAHPVGRDHSTDDSTCPAGHTCLFNETPEHDVVIDPFVLDKYNVTVGRFRNFVDAWNDNWRPEVGAGANAAIEGTGWQPSWDDQINASLQGNLNNCYDGGTWTDEPGSHEDWPLTCVSWYEAMAFCIWDGGRIATEAEFEFAAGGGEDNRPFPWGGAPLDDTRLVTDQPIGPVGTKPDGAGKWGHLDMAGNTEEWVYDCWSTEFFGSPRVPRTTPRSSPSMARFRASSPATASRRIRE